MKKLTTALILAIGPLGGCGAVPDGALDESVAQESAPLTDSPFTLRNLQTGLCLGVKAGTPTYGTPFIVWTCDGSANQTFTKGPPSQHDPAFIQLKNGVGENRCLGASGWSNNNPVNVQRCSTNDRVSNWKPIYAGNNSSGHECYRFMQEMGAQFPDPKVFGVKGGSTALGTPVIIWSDLNNSLAHPNQFWCVY
jgi:hypothetical protein